MIMKKYEITKEQIEILSKSSSVYNANSNLMEWFPEAFKKELPHDFTGWCKLDNCGNDDWLMFFNNGIQKYGIDSNGDWFVPAGTSVMKKYSIEATESEIYEALKKEAVKRGYKEKDIITDIYYSGYCTLNQNGFEYNKRALWMGDCVLFQKGQWAEKIPTKTKSEAEKELNCKIID